MNKWLIAVLTLACVFSGPASGRTVIHKERSVYQAIHVIKDGSQLCLQFSVRRNQRNQTCVDQRRPKEMVFTYTRMMMASLLLIDEPTRILMIGLGGGTLPMALNELYPEAHIDAVEIDGAVVRVAKEYFDFKENENIAVHVVDARVFTKRALRRNQKYDLILLDAYNGDYIPEHLMTQEYLEENLALLDTGGVLSSNTFAISRLYDHESVTYENVFGEFFNFKLWNSANRVIIARPDGLPTAEEMTARAKTLNGPLSDYGVPIERYVRSLVVKRDWHRSARPLTDQYAPANILNQQAE